MSVIEILVDECLMLRYNLIDCKISVSNNPMIRHLVQMGLMLVFHKDWNIVGPDVVADVQSFITTGFLLKERNATIIIIETSI